MIAGRRLGETSDGGELLIFNKMPAYCLKHGERVGDGIKRIVREEIAAAVGYLNGEGAGGSDEAIHEARKSVKKIRGALRLVQPEMGKIYAIENRFFRDIGRQLSTFRDATASVETFDELRKKYRGDLDGRMLAAMRRRLTARKAQAEKEAGIGEVLKTVTAALEGAAARVDGWPLSKDGFAAIAPGLEATFRRGRKALARAQKHPRAENYHDWRKRVKEQWYHIRLLEGLRNPEMQASERELKDLEEALGADHNLVVLRERMVGEPAYYASKAEVRRVVRAMDAYRKELSDEAFRLGERIYAESPGHFTRRVGRLWEAGSWA